MRALKIGFWAFLTLAIIVICVFFALQNNDPMTVTLLGQTTEVQPKWKILLITAVVGALLSTIFFIVELVVLESKNIRLRRNNRRLMRSLEKRENAEAKAGPELNAATKDATPAEPSFRVAPDDEDV